MILRVLLILLCAAGLVSAYNPVPNTLSEEEIAFQAALETAEDDEARTELAQEYLNRYPDNVTLGRSAQNVLNRYSELSADWYRERMDANPSSTNRYLWARASKDNETMLEQAAWIMENDPENFWGYYLAGVAHWDQEEPDLTQVTDYLEQAVAKDPSQFIGFFWLGYAYEETENLSRALEAFKAAQIVDPEDEGPKHAMIGIHAQQREADKYFELLGDMLPAVPLTAELAVANPNSTDKITPDALKGEMVVLECFAHWCAPCVKHSLPEMNELAAKDELPFKFYAVHAEGEHEKARALFDSTDANGKEWALTFCWGNDEFREQVGGVHAFPSYYVMDDQARPRALLIGHSKNTVETLQWLIEEIKKRS